MENYPKPVTKDTHKKIMEYLDNSIYKIKGNDDNTGIGFFCKMITDTPETALYQRINCSLNDSSTKQAYSFGRALRFKPSSKKDNLYHFYSLPDIKNTRSTTLGYGKKCNYNQMVGCGSNQLYAAPSYFDPKYHNAPLYSFGVSRPKGRRQDNSPGPKYNVTNKIGEGPSFVFGTAVRQTNKKLKRSNSVVPGPGAYYNEIHHQIGGNVNYNSKLMNLANIVIGKEKRFLAKERDQTPGPGAYNVPGLINETGMLNFNSKYVSIPARSFIGKRNAYRIRKVDSSPGPGQYNFFSIFEGYSNSNKI